MHKLNSGSVRLLVCIRVQNHGSRPSTTDSTFVLHDEDHTMGNALRYALMRR